MKEDEFAHYGVKGMRWGIRSANPGTSASTSRSAAATKRKVQAPTGPSRARRAGTASVKVAKSVNKHGAPIAKVAIKRGAQTAAIGLLVGIGAPPAVAAMGVGILAAAYPGVVRNGSDFVKLTLDGAGFRDMTMSETAAHNTRYATAIVKEHFEPSARKYFE